jgi:hypothetical protein
MNIRYIFINDSVDAKEIKLNMTPLRELLLIFHKASSRHHLRVLCDAVMNIGYSSNYHSGNRSVLNLEAYKDKAQVHEVHKYKAQDYKDYKIDYRIDSDVA